MFFEDRVRSKTFNESELTEAEAQTMKENAENVDWKDFLALTIAGFQILSLRIGLYLLSYLVLIALFFVYFVW